MSDSSAAADASATPGTPIEQATRIFAKENPDNFIAEIINALFGEPTTDTLPPLPDMIDYPWLPENEKLGYFKNEREQQRTVERVIKTGVEFEMTPDTPEVEQRNAERLKRFIDGREAARRVAQIWKPHYSRKNLSAYNNTAVRDELAILRNPPDGYNDQLNISALKLARLPDGKGGFALDRDWLRERLVDVMHANGYVRDKGINAVHNTIGSAFAKADKDGPRV